MIPDNTTRIPVNRNLLARFFSKVYTCDDMWFNNSPCWLWSGAKSWDGYALVKFEGNMRKAHRIMFGMFVHRIDAARTADHLCRIRHCVNPTHIEDVSGKINTLRGESIAAKNARKTECPQGHQFTPENTYVNSKGSRVCRTCSRIQGRVNDKKRSAKRTIYARERRHRLSS